MDPEGDDVWYQINWGDGNIEEWAGPYDSNEIAIKEHKWDMNGNYTIMARAKDEFDAIGNWSEFEITIPRTIASSYLWFEWLFGCFPMLEKLLNLIR